MDRAAEGQHIFSSRFRLAFNFGILGFAVVVQIDLFRGAALEFAYFFL
jgi:hypothetical protein